MFTYITSNNCLWCDDQVLNQSSFNKSACWLNLSSLYPHTVEPLQTSPPLNQTNWLVPIFSLYNYPFKPVTCEFWITDDFARKKSLFQHESTFKNRTCFYRLKNRSCICASALSKNQVCMQFSRLFLTQCQLSWFIDQMSIFKGWKGRIYQMRFTHFVQVYCWFILA